MLLLLSSETFLSSFVGPQGANLLVVAPVAFLAYLSLVVRPALSSRFRAHTSQFFSRLVRKRAHAITFALFVASFGFSFVRAIQFGTFDIVGATFQVVKWGSVTIVLCAAASAWRVEGEPDPMLRTIAVALSAYIGVNLLFMAAGIQNSTLNAQYLTAGGTGSMFSLIGLSVPRLPLPISGGLNTSGLQVASAIAMGVALALRGGMRTHRLLVTTLVVGGVIALLITDSRGGMLGAAGGCLLIVAPGWLRARARWLTLMLPVLPLLLVLVATLVQNEPWAQELQRGGTEGVGGALTGRPLIWGTIVLSLASFQVTHLFGYGALGQLGSGVSEIYSAVFASSYATAVGAGAHNTLLQAVLDVGYVGATLQLVLLWHLLSWFGRASSTRDSADPWALVGLGATVSLVFIGITGETLSIGSPNTLVLFLALNVHCLLADDALAQPTPASS